MNVKNQYNGFKRVKWENKSEKEKANVLRKQFSNLNYKIPKYLEKEKISNKQLEKAIQRIEKGYNVKIEKLAPTPKLSDINFEVQKYNKTVDKVLSKLKNMGYSDKAIEFLQGNFVSTTMRKKSYFLNNSPFEKVDIDSLKLNKKGRKTFMDNLKNNKKLLTDKDIMNKLLNKEDNINWFKDMLGTSIFDNIDSTSMDSIIARFSELNNVQQEVLIKNTLNELKEKYENDDITLEGDHLANAYNKLSNHILDIQKEI